MAGERLKSSLWIQACIFRADREGIHAAVLRKGDPDSGSILVRLDRRGLGCAVLAETHDATGERAWYRGTGPENVPTETADAYIARHVTRDPDLWVIEIDDQRGRLPFDDRVLSS
jgi:hypothetical protein